MENVADSVLGHTRNYIIIVNVCSFIWPGNKPLKTWGKLFSVRRQECEKWDSRHAQEVCGFCIIILFVRPMSWFMWHKVITSGNNLSDVPRSIPAHLSRQSYFSHDVNTAAHPDLLSVDTDASWRRLFLLGVTLLCALPVLTITRHYQGNETLFNEPFCVCFFLICSK